MSLIAYQTKPGLDRILLKNEGPIPVHNLHCSRLIDQVAVMAESLLLQLVVGGVAALASELACGLRVSLVVLPD